MAWQRRTAIWAVVLAVLFVALLLPIGTDAPARAQVEPEETRPNILLIVTDDQAIRTMAAMPRTLHWFRDEGVRFARAFVSTPLCCPSRTSIMTGLYAHNHQVKHNYDFANFPTDKSIQAYLQGAGYRTAIAGKYLNDTIEDPPFWDRFGIMQHGYYNTDFNLDGERKEVRTYSTDFVSHKALEFLYETEDTDEQPWFLYVAPYAPHPPATPSPTFKASTVPEWTPDPGTEEKNRSDKPAFVQNRTTDIERIKSLYRRQQRSLLSVDQLVDRLFNALGDTKERKNTLAIFISDNGMTHGDHGLGGKRFPYTRSIQVPFFMRWPTHLVKGSTNRRYTMNLDIAPTVLDAAGVTPQHTYDGFSLINPRARNRVLTEYYRDSRPNQVDIPTWASLRTADYQYIEYYEDDGTLSLQEYYNLDKDPYQLRNLFGDGNPANDPDVEALHQQLEADRSCEGIACP